MVLAVFVNDDNATSATRAMQEMAEHDSQNKEFNSLQLSSA